MMRKTAPKAQALKERAKPLTDVVGNRMEASNKMVGQLLHRPSQRSTESAATSSSMALERMESVKQRQQKERQNAATAQLQRFLLLDLLIICC
jgi:hypothetical protein